MSPILVRPVREQLEHDRLIRHLQLKYKRKFEVAVNVGDEQVSPVKIGQSTFYPDLVLTTASGRKLAGVIEIETGESVNNLEAMAQWVHFSRSRVPFHLYVPVQGYDAARRLCEANHVRVSEIWTYRSLLDGFDVVRVSSDPAAQHARLSVHAARFPAKPASAQAKPAANKPAVAKAPARPSNGKPSPRPAKKATGTPKKTRLEPAVRRNGGTGKKGAPAKAAKRTVPGKKR